MFLIGFYDGAGEFLGAHGIGVGYRDAQEAAAPNKLDGGFGLEDGGSAGSCADHPLSLFCFVLYSI